MTITIPKIYTVVKKDKEYFLQEYSDSFVLPSKIYGGLDVIATRTWRTFSIEKGSMGIMLTGISGGGKTTVGEIICNIALANSFAVVMVTEIEADLGLVRFIDSLDRCVVLLDEFAKNFNRLQNKMLTMFNNLNYTSKLFIITENDKKSISYLIRNRPGRIKYHRDFKRIDESSVKEYCFDKGIDLKGKLYKDLYNVYEKSIDFSFDHLKAIVSEHRLYPEDSLDDLIEMLNLEILSGSDKLFCKECKELEGGATVSLTPNNNNITYSEFNNGRNIWLYTSETNKGICVSKDNIVQIDGDDIHCLVDKKYELILTIEK